MRALLFSIVLAQAACGCGSPTLPSFANPPPPPPLEDAAADGDEDAGAEDTGPDASD